ncbi:MAG: hypothetical protein HYZ71_12900 [Deltaproteobacteria bacterium]|nr:hypothetical protein [Deltaproteobacteria bacterium]
MGRFFVLMLVSALCQADDIPIKVQGIEELREYFQLKAYQGLRNPVKVMVLGSGFGGVEAGTKLLPQNTEIIDFSKAPRATNDPHDLQMAQIVWGMTGYAEEHLKIVLAQIDGVDAFGHACQAIIKTIRPDIVVFSNVWHAFGNFDGVSGPVDSWINEVTGHGIIWINAAGNNGGLVSNQKIIPNDFPEGRFVELPYQGKYLRFRNRVDDNTVTVSVAWNAYGSGFKWRGTEKSLKLSVIQPDGKEIAAEVKHVVGEPKAGEDIHPRQTLTLPHLKAFGGRDYLISLQIIGGDFNPRTDTVRVTLASSASADESTSEQDIDFLDRTEDNELGTAAVASGITVGDFSKHSAKGAPFSGKPEVLLDRREIMFTNLRGATGTSFSTAILGGIATVLKSHNQNLTQRDLLSFRSSVPGAVLADGKWSQSKSEVPWSVKRFLLGRAIDYVVYTEPTGIPYLGLLSPLSKLPGFERLPNEVKRSPDDYRTFLSWGPVNARDFGVVVSYSGLKEAAPSGTLVEFGALMALPSSGARYWRTPTEKELSSVGAAR